MQELNLYDERKTAQAAAFFLNKAGGTLPYIHLIKLLYIADRKSFERYGESITGDNYVSMKHGPVLSTTYDRIKGTGVGPQSHWSFYVSPRSGWDVSSNREISDPCEELLALSESDFSILDEVSEEFLHLDRWDLIEQIHNQFGEWKDPGSTSQPIEHESLLSEIGYSEEEIAATMEYLKERSIMNTELP